MTTYRVSHQSGHIEAKLSIHGSKSIHQRLLVIKHLYQNNLKLSNPSHSNDVLVLTEALLQINKKKGQGCNINVQDAGTATRLLVPILAITPGMWNLEGTARMNERPISDLVDSLGSLNDQIEYANETGKLPLTIRGIEPQIISNRIFDIDISKSSQFASAIALIGPSIATSTTIRLQGSLRSLPYFKLTLEMLATFGLEIDWLDLRTVTISGQMNKIQNYPIEPDWSSLSYWYSLLAMSSSGDLALSNITFPAIQGDAWVHSFFQQHNLIDVEHRQNQMVAYKRRAELEEIHIDFKDIPDLAPTLIVMCSVLCRKFSFSGVESLAYKESNRIEALLNELNKIGITFTSEEGKYTKASSLKWPKSSPRFDSYDDHRIAMAFAVMGIIKPVEIRNIEVVKKSYPGFWDDLRKVNFVLDPID